MRKDNQDNRFLKKNLSLGQMKLIRLVILIQFVGQPLIDYVYPNKALTSGIKILCSVILLLMAFQREKKVTLKNKRIDVLSLFPLALLAIYSLSGVLNSQRFEINILVIGIWIIYFLKKKTHIPTILSYFSQVVATLCILSLITIILRLNYQSLYFPSNGYFLPLNSLFEVIGRQFGIFTHPNSLGQMGLLAIAFFSSKKYGNTVFATIGGVCVILSGSRTALVASVLILFFLSYKRITKRESINIPKIRTIILVTILGILVFTISNIAIGINSQTFTGRGLIWIEMFKLVPVLFGGGPGFVENQIENRNLPHFANSPHSSFLEVYAFGGLFGGLVFIILILISLKNSRKSVEFPTLVLLALLINAITETNINFSSLNISTLIFILLYYWDEDIYGI